MTSNPFTRAASKSAFIHIMTNVLDSDHIHQALKDAGIDDMTGLVRLDDHTVENLAYTDPDPQVSTKYPLKKGEMGLLISFVHFVYYRKDIGNPIGNDWTSITMDEFDEFRTNLDYASGLNTLSGLNPKKAPSKPTSTTSNPTTSGHGFNPVDSFKRGIKRDPTVFPTLKDEKLNDQWHRSFLNQARAQDIEDVLDPTFKPTSSIDIALFQEKKKYLYAVLVSILLRSLIKDFFLI